MPAHFAPGGAGQGNSSAVTPPPFLQWGAFQSLWDVPSSRSTQSLVDVPSLLHAPPAASRSRKRSSGQVGGCPAFGVLPVASALPVSAITGDSEGRGRARRLSQLWRPCGAFGDWAH